MTRQRAFKTRIKGPMLLGGVKQHSSRALACYQCARDLLDTMKAINVDAGNTVDIAIIAECYASNVIVCAQPELHQKAGVQS